MSYDINATFSSEQVKIEGSYPINMYVLNASVTGWDPLYYAELNQDVVGFTMQDGGTLTSSEQTYTGIPISSDDIKTSLEGDIPELNITVPNVDRTIESYIQNYNYLRNCEVYKITIFARHLPSGSTYAHIGTTPDYNSCIIESMYVDSVTSNEESVTFTCKPKFNIANAVLPRRRFTIECSWTYNDTACSVDPTVYSTYTTCNYSLDDCRMRQNESRFGGFPAIPKGSIWVQR